jgi:type IV pilus assembly protein PilY1
VAALRQFEPFVMVMVDTSGSMERLPTCPCTTPGCEECLPKCGAPNEIKPHEDSAAHPADETDEDHIKMRKNRWAFTLEALTGQFNDFQCNEVERRPENGATYDLGYYLPYHQPWKCKDPDTNLVTNDFACPMPDTLPNDRPTSGEMGVAMQQDNGVLDRYASRLRFGLMTFDGVETYQGANPLITSTLFNTARSESELGMWSYAGPKPYRYVGCAEDYKIDTGARSSLATEGALISLNSNACASPPCTQYQVNETIQQALLRSRPYGGTPIAATLDDLFYHLKTDVDDSLAKCRNTYGLLITDGYPDTDFREHGCDCKIEGNCKTKFDPTITDAEIDLLRCPYPRPEEAARRLKQGYDGEPSQLEQLFVIGISVDDQRVKDVLNLIAEEGGSTLKDGDENLARFAEGFNELTATLDEMFSGLTDPVSRAVPAFATNHLEPYRTFRLTAGFRKADGQVNDDGHVPPWVGIVERQRFTCDDTTVPVGVDIDDSDRFHSRLEERPEDIEGGGPRTIYTALPTGTLTTGDLEGTLTRGVDNAKCGSASGDFCMMRELDPSSGQLDPALLGITAATAEQTLEEQRQDVMDWMYGREDSIRHGQSLGDIYHSSPTFARPSVHDDMSDDSYSKFLELPEVASKPLVMYIGSNDGILHAFNVDKNGSGVDEDKYVASVALNTPNSGVKYLEGQEKDVFFQKSDPPVDRDYHTVLASGLRGGGKAYFALDVTDPIQPKFLWQFTDPQLGTPLLGYTYGKPVLAQMEVDYMAGTKRIQGVRAVAILAGGRGTKWNGVAPAPPGCTVGSPLLQESARDGSEVYKTYGSITDLSKEIDHRSHVPCWNTEGRALFFVDVESGHLIKALWSTDGGTNMIFKSPLVGSPTVYPDAVGTIAKQGFVMDADGVLWRFDVSSNQPDEWSARPFHDLFWDRPAAGGETTYEMPLLSLDDKRRLVIITGTGDTDNFEKPTVENKVVSLTQLVASDGEAKAVLNWELEGNRDASNSTTGMIVSELVTGSMALFEGRLFFATFAPKVGTDPCDVGRGRLWSVHYNRHSTTANPTAKAATTYPPTFLDISGAEQARNTADSGIGFFNVPISVAPQNTMIFGLGATQLRCPRGDTDDDFTNYFSEKLPAIEDSGTPTIWLVAQTSGDRGLRKFGSELGSINVQLDRGTSFAKMTSWASSTD